MDVIYTHRTRFSGYLARPHTKSSGQPDPDWFLVLIDGTEYARHRTEYTFDVLPSDLAVGFPKYEKTRLFNSFMRWFNRNIKGTALLTAENELIARLVVRYSRIHGLTDRERAALVDAVRDARPRSE